MPANEFRNLVFEGGGVWGIAYGGALEELQEMGILPKIVRVAGSSAGAITAALLACGYSAQELKKTIAETDFSGFADDDRWFLTNIIRVIRQFGWHKGDRFRDWMAERIAEKTGTGDLTFSQLKGMSTREGFRELFIIGTDLSAQGNRIFSAKETPEMRICDAVRISMSIPLYFKCVRLSDEVMVDGGLAWNYPIQFFDRIGYLDNPANGEPVTYNQDRDYLFNHETLGFRLDNKEEISANFRSWSNEPINIKNFLGYLKAALAFLRAMANKRHLHRNDWERTVFIDTGEIGFTKFSLSQAEIDALVESGRKGVIDYFKWRNGPTGLSRP